MSPAGAGGGGRTYGRCFFASAAVTRRVSAATATIHTFQLMVALLTPRINDQHRSGAFCSNRSADLAGDHAQAVRPSMPLERDQGAHRHVELAQLLGAAELGKVDDETGGEDVGSHLAQELDRAFRSAAGRDQVVDQ